MYTIYYIIFTACGKHVLAYFNHHIIITHQGHNSDHTGSSYSRLEKRCIVVNYTIYSVVDSIVKVFVYIYLYIVEIMYQ